LRIEEINDDMRETLLETGRKFYELYGYQNKGITALLNFYGEGEQILVTYIHTLEEKERREKDERER